MIWSFTMPGECRKASWERETEIPYPVVFPPSIAPQFNESNWELRVLFKGLGRQASCIIFVILLHQHHLLKFSSAGKSPAESHLREPLPKASKKNYIALIPFRSLFPTISFPPHHTPLPINSPVHKRRLPLERCHGAFARSSELPPFPHVCSPVMILHSLSFKKLKGCGNQGDGIPARWLDSKPASERNLDRPWNPPGKLLWGSGLDLHKTFYCHISK